MNAELEKGAKKAIDRIVEKYNKGARFDVASCPTTTTFINHCCSEG